MLSNKKKVGALLGTIIVGSILIVSLLRLNPSPKELVEDGTSGQSNPPDQPEISSVAPPDTLATGESSSTPSYRPAELTESSGEVPEPPAKPTELVDAHPASSAAQDASKAPSGSSKPEASSDQSKTGGQGSEPASEEKPSEEKPSGTTPEQQPGEKTPEATKEPATDTKLAKALEGANAFYKQSLGNTPVVFYQHPTQSLGLDLRRSGDMARQIYVYPQKEGFLVFPRIMLQVLGLSEDQLEEWLKKNTIPGAVEVKKVDKPSRTRLEKDRMRSVKFIDAEEDYSYAIEQKSQPGKEYSPIYQLLEKPFTVDFVRSNLTTGGMIGNPPAAGKDVAWKKQLETWEKIKTAFQDNPAVEEIRYSLPLLAETEGYQVDGKDVRANVPLDPPTYRFGQEDLNGDGSPEFLVHAQTKFSEKGQAEGYWMILTPSPKGLKVAKVLYRGNGELLQSGKDLISPSMTENKEGKVLQLEEAELEKAEKQEEKKLTFQKVTGQTGKDLAKKYPQAGLVLLGEEVYVLDLKAYDAFLDYALNKMEGVERLHFLGDVEGADGKVQKDAVRREKIEDPILYLQELYPDLPFLPDRLQKLVKTEQFKDLASPITAETFDRVE